MGGGGTAPAPGAIGGAAAAGSGSAAGGGGKPPDLLQTIKILKTLKRKRDVASDAKKSPGKWKEG